MLFIAVIWVKIIFFGVISHKIFEVLLIVLKSLITHFQTINPYSEDACEEGQETNIRRDRQLERFGMDVC